MSYSDASVEMDEVNAQRDGSYGADRTGNRTASSANLVSSPPSKDELILLLRELVATRWSCSASEEYLLRITAYYLEEIHRRSSPFSELFKDLRPASYSNDERWALHVLIALEEHCGATYSPTIETMVEHLSNRNIILDSMDIEGCSITNDGRSETLRLANSVAFNKRCSFVFGMIGVVTYLYQPLFENSLPGRLKFRHFSIAQSTSPTLHHFHGIYCGRADAHTRRPIRDAFKSFGELLPTIANPRREPPALTRPLYTELFNSEIMISVLRMNIEWTDTLCAHLDFDEQSKTVFLFRSPSICMINIKGESLLDLESPKPSLMDCCTGASDDTVTSDVDYCSAMMHEIVVSTEIIFRRRRKGTSTAASTWLNCFASSKVKNHRQLLDNCKDPVLAEITYKGWPFIPGPERSEKNYGTLGLPYHQPKDVYHLPTDFPHLATKLASVYEFVEEQQPQSLIQLWKDKRNTLQWYTFWAVVILGGLSLFLSVVQTSLGIAQVYYAAKNG